VVEICNAGHLPPLLLHDGGISRIESTGLPVGVFSSETFSVNCFDLAKGDTLFLYTDGFSESRDGAGNEYGADRVSQLLDENQDLSPESIISLCKHELHTFAEGKLPGDDLTLMAIRRTK
jgi:sigma-B regulation protein RsbU (phosphoserine phosphatase)